MSAATVHARPHPPETTCRFGCSFRARRIKHERCRPASAVPHNLDITATDPPCWLLGSLNGCYTCREACVYSSSIHDSDEPASPQPVPASNPVVHPGLDVLFHAPHIFALRLFDGI
jgi:hypothetical protein